LTGGSEKKTGPALLREPGRKNYGMENLHRRAASRNFDPAPLSEQQIQKALFAILRQRGAPGLFCWHPFSGGYRRPKEAAIYRGLGAIAGLPDVMILHQGKLYCVELKREGGGLTETQEQVLIRLREAGAMATHAHGLDQALRVLEGWGLLLGHTS
jgi:hypothetical protein